MMIEASPSNLLHMGSDHRAIRANFNIHRIPKKKSRKQNRKRWKVQLDSNDNATAYQQSLDEILTSEHREFSLLNAEHMILTCANDHNEFNHESTAELKPWQHPEFKAL
eukprot:7187067-Karenia_brevis.AAC.1